MEADLEALTYALASRIQRRTGNLRETFLRYDKYGTGTLTVPELAHAINRSWGVKISRQQVRAMMLSFQYKQGTLDTDYESKPVEFEYDEFVDFVEEFLYNSGQTESQRIGRITDASLLQDQDVGLIEVPEGAARAEILAVVGRKIRSRSSRGLPTHELFLSFDADRTGRVSEAEFQNWFRKNGLALTVAQTQDLLSEFDRSGDGRLSYPEFTAFLAQASRGGQAVAAGGGGGRAAWERPDRDDREAASAAKRRARAERVLSRQMAMEAQQAANEALSHIAGEAMSDVQLLSSIAGRMQDKKWKLMAAFRKFDTSGSGRVSAEEFAAGCAELGLSVSEQRLAPLVRRFDVKGDGALRYFEFVRLISSSNDPNVSPPLPGGGSTPGEAQAVGGAAANIVPVLSAASSSSSSDGSGGGGTGGALVFAQEADESASFVDEEAAESAAIAEGLTAEDVAALQEFRAVLEEERLKMTSVFKSFDATGDKTIGIGELRQGLTSLGVKVSDDEAARILRRFDITGNGKIKYFEFVRMVSDALEIA